MLKYLVKRNNTYWFRRLIKGHKEIIFSLKTKNYSVALLRHSFINHKLNTLIYSGVIKMLTADELNTIMDKYKDYMITGEINEYSEIRDKELATTINGEFYGGHTKEALSKKLQEYKQIHKKDDLELVKKETAKILNRCNIKDEFDKLDNDTDKKNFHWKLFKAEKSILIKALQFQQELDKEDELINITTPVSQQLSEIKPKKKKKKKLKLSQLFEMYIEEKESIKPLGDKNKRDLEYVFKHLISWFDDESVYKLTRKDFSRFRKNCVIKLPQSPTRKEFKNKTTKEIIQIVEEKSFETLGTITINKHMRRIHQVFNWAHNIAGLIKFNPTKDFQIQDSSTSSKSKKESKVPYSEEDLKNIFENSPRFSSELEKELIKNPSNIFIPLLCLFMGAKPTELALLKTNDIKLHKGIWVVDIHEKVKNDFNIRRVPISDKLIEIGFLKYVNYQKKYKEEKLFSEIKEFKSGGTKFTNEFSTFNRTYISKDKKKSFYSFRHMTNQLLKNNNVELYIINDILGHSTGSSNHDISVYGDKQMPEAKMKETIDRCLVYDFLDFAYIKKCINKVY